MNILVDSKIKLIYITKPEFFQEYYIMNITKRAKNVEQKWVHIDAADKVLGRLATKIAKILTGKNKEYYSRDMICGDFVVVTNADKIKVTGNKLDNKIYYWHSGYPGGLKQKNLAEMLKTKPEYVLSHAVSGMLAKNKLRAKLIKNLKVYTGTEHPHKAQKCITIEL